MHAKYCIVDFYRIFCHFSSNDLHCLRNPRRNLSVCEQDLSGASSDKKRSTQYIDTGFFTTPNQMGAERFPLLMNHNKTPWIFTAWPFSVRNNGDLADTTDSFWAGCGICLLIKVRSEPLLTKLTMFKNAFDLTIIKILTR